MKETFPRAERIHYNFPGTARTAGRTIQVTRHDGGNLPDLAECDLPLDTKLPPNGCMFVGECEREVVSAFPRVDTRPDTDTRG